MEKTKSLEYPGSRILQEWREVVVGIHRMRMVIWALILKELMLRLGAGKLGLIWIVLDPVFGMLMMSGIWTIIGRDDIEGVPVTLFIGSGFAMFQIVQKGYQRVASAISLNLQLLNYPQVKPLDTVIAKFILEMWLHVIAIIMMFFGLWWIAGFYGTFPFPLDCLKAMGSGALLSIGFAVPLAVYGTLYETVAKVVSLITRPLMLFSAVLYSMNDIPPAGQAILTWNPIIHIIMSFRHGAYGIKLFSGHSLAYPSMIGLVMLGFGMVSYYAFRYRLIQL